MSHMSVLDVVHSLVLLAILLALCIKNQNIPVTQMLEFLDKAGRQAFWLSVLTLVLPLAHKLFSA